MHENSRSTDYEQIASTYDSRYERNSYAGVERALLEFVGDQPRAAILEVGCGTGHWLAQLQERGIRTTGLDLSPGMLANARRRLPSVSLIQGTASQLPWRSGTFDRLFCINAIHHFPHKRMFLTEARRILRPGGQIMIIGLDPHSARDRWFVYDYFPESLLIDRQRYPASASLRRWMSEAGFRDCNTQEVEHWNYRLPAREILKQGRLDKVSTSQLSVLTEAEYQRGMEKIRATMAQAEAEGKTLFLEADLRLYATVGRAA